MTQNPIPGLSMMPGPNQLSKTGQNNNAMLRYTKTISPRMYCVDGAFYAPTPPPAAPSDAYLMIAGFQGVEFSSGAGTLTYPLPFPNGVLYVSVSTFGVTNTVGVGASGFTLATLPVLASTSGSLVILYQAIGW